MASEFQQDYKTLELDLRSDWETASANYRQLVNLWHPDRYTEQPAEQEKAQQRFIDLTKSFNKLRAFHRENQRLPFERSKPGQSPAQPTANVRRPSTRDVTEAGLLSPRRTPRITESSLTWRRRMLWVMPGICLIGGSLLFFLIMDNNARKQSLQQAREVLRQTPTSEFLPSAVEVNRQTSRGAFLNDDGHKLGDYLMKDVLRP